MHSDQNRDIFLEPNCFLNIKERIFFRKASILTHFTNIEGFLLDLIRDIKENKNALSPKSGHSFSTKFFAKSNRAHIF